MMQALTAMMGPDEKAARVETIASQRKVLSQQKRKLTDALKAEKRKQQRKIAKSARLSNLDLLEVLRFRQEKKQKAEGAA